jgi:hypothetical protein
MHLGHQFLTDVLEIRIDQSHLRETLLSTMYALIEGAAILGIPRDDLDGALNVIGPERFSLVIFDAVPGGAGHAHKIAERFDRVVAAALDRVADCPDCAEDTSCYSCLRSYSNQRHHEDLRRSAARQLLSMLVGESEAELAGLDYADPSTHPLLRALFDRGLPQPRVGLELDDQDRSILELAWPSRKYAIVLDADEGRDQALTHKGWTFDLLDDVTVDSVESVLTTEVPDDPSKDPE